MKTPTVNRRRLVKVIFKRTVYPFKKYWMINRLRNLLFLKMKEQKQEWEYGTCNGTAARRHIKNKNVQFVLWKAGEQGHKEDCWHNFDSSWWEGFKTFKEMGFD